VPFVAGNDSFHFGQATAKEFEGRALPWLHFTGQLYESPDMLSTQLFRSEADNSAAFSNKYEEMEGSLDCFERRQVANRTFLAAMEGNRVVGLVCIMESSRRVPGAITICYVSVREDRRNQGVAKLLVRALFEFAKVEGFSIANTQYEDDGQLYLRRVLEATAISTPEVAFHEFPYNLL